MPATLVLYDNWVLYAASLEDSWTERWESPKLTQIIQKVHSSIVHNLYLIFRLLFKILLLLSSPWNFHRVNRSGLKSYDYKQTFKIQKKLKEILKG